MSNENKSPDPEGRGRIEAETARADKPQPGTEATDGARSIAPRPAMPQPAESAKIPASSSNGDSSLNQAAAAQPTGGTSKPGFQQPDARENSEAAHEALARETPAFAEMHARAMREAHANFRSALERNGQTTVTLLNRALETIEHQNRRLGDVDRRLAELAGQVRSLKNPR